MAIRPQLITVAALRSRLAEVLGMLQRTRRPLYVTQRGQARAVLLSAKEFEALLDQLEYLDDSLEGMLAAERRREGKERTIPWEQVKRDLERRGRLPATRKTKRQHGRAAS